MKLSDAKPIELATIKRALFSVFDKTGVVELAKALAEAGVELVASGGTQQALAAAGLKVVSVESITQSPEVLGGRVKTLHPKIHAGILSHRTDAEHQKDMQAHGYLNIDVVICNLYPFAEAKKRNASYSEMVENIDIGGPTMVRGAAKNADGGVCILTRAQDYEAFAAELKSKGGITLATRRKLAGVAFAGIAHYDAMIADWFASANAEPHTGSADAFPKTLQSFHHVQSLRYGENPHQKAALYACDSDLGGVARGTLLSGKELSYNNYLDMDGAFRAVAGMAGHACAIVKHTNPCGIALAPTQALAFERALAGDPVSAFGSIISFSKPVEMATAQAMVASKLFVECIVAPGFAPDALALLSKKENLRLFVAATEHAHPGFGAHRIGGGMLVQEADVGPTDPKDWQCVTQKPVESAWRDELAFAMHVVYTLKSNAICVTKDQALLGAGAGQMSRVDAVAQALKKAGDKARGAFLASDAFFPFDDNVRLAAEAGIAAIVQPGGSKRDAEVIAACNELGIAMLFCGRRHFRH